MTSIAWKRKLSTNIQGNSAALFTDGDDVEDLTSETGADENLVRLVAKKKCNLGSAAESARLIDEGIFLAERQRYWEAINRFDDALSYKLNEGKLYEMKAQALLELNELHPAVEAAEKAIKKAPLWAEAYQTFGRAQISIGNIDIAIRGFCIALHLKPDFEEITKEDLPWALNLRMKQKDMQNANQSEEKDSSEEKCGSSLDLEKESVKYVKLNIMEPS